jgi:hypothetical protein
MTSLSVVDVKPGDRLLQDIITLGDENSATLGFLSRDTYTQYAAKGSLFAAIDGNNALVGYVLYRTLRKANYAVIVHFCVSPRFRRPSSIYLLFDALCERTRLLNGLFLKMGCFLSVGAIFRILRKCGNTSDFDHLGMCQGAANRIQH